MSHALKSALIAALSLPFAVQLSGCSLIGLGIGATMDGDPTRLRESPGRVVTVDPGTPVVLDLASGAQVRGTFAGVGRENSEEYAARYRAWRDTHARIAWVPAIGDSVVLETRGGERIPACFLGFSYRAIEARPAGDALTRSYPFEGVLRISGAAGSLAGGDSLASRDASGELPGMTSILLSHGNHVSAVPLDQVRTIRGVTHGAARKGFLIGLAMDVSFVLVAVVVASSPWDDSGGCDPYTNAMLAPGVRPLYTPYDRLLGRPLEPPFAKR